MKRALFSILAIAVVFPASVAAARTSPLIIDHNSIPAYFNSPDGLSKYWTEIYGMLLANQIPGQIPPVYITAAENRRLTLRHASIGLNTFGSLCTGCPINGSIGATNRYHNWDFVFRSNQDFYWKVDDFVNTVPGQVNSYDDFSFKFCFIDYANDGVGTNDPQAGFEYLRSRLEALESSPQIVNKNIIWWTMPLTNGSPDPFNNGFGYGVNSLIRAYARQHNKILFDFADIESHRPDGSWVNSGGREYAYDAYCGEPLPNASCHPSGLGQVRLNYGWYTLMAQLSGWNQQGPTATPVPTAAPTTLPTPTPTPGDANSDGHVDGIDYVIWLNHYNTTGSGPAVGDFNNDGRVDGVDYVVWLNNYGK